jgi:hypothetical protein
MFRKRTDQVYSTLQQVQRRITEQAGGTAQVGDEFRSPVQPQQSLVTLQPLSQALPMQSPAAPAPVQPLPPAVAPGKRYVLQLSGDLAMLLMVVWLVSMALMFYLGKNWHPGAGAGLAPGDAGHRESAAAEAPPVRRQGDYIYVLISEPTVTPKNEAEYRSLAQHWNEVVERNPGRGWKPYFDVRKPGNGGIELVFGSVDGQFGINKDEFVAFADLLSKPVSSHGGGFLRARWVRIDDK